MAFSPMCLEIVKAEQPRLHGFIKKADRSYRYCLTTSVSVSSPLV